MVDVFSKKKRSEIMSRIKGRDTGPEKALWSALNALKLRHRRYVKSLPGTPEAVVPTSKAVLLVHGCFWHGHIGCRRAKLPTSNRRFWSEKVMGNRRRDLKQARALRRSGWHVGVFWTCTAITPARLAGKLRLLRVGR